MKKTIVVLLLMASLGLFSVLVAGEIYVSPDGGFETHVPFIPLEERDLCADITIKNNLMDGYFGVR